MVIVEGKVEGSIEEDMVDSSVVKTKLERPKTLEACVIVNMVFN